MKDLNVKTNKETIRMHKDAAYDYYLSYSENLKFSYGEDYGDCLEKASTWYEIYQERLKELKELES